LILDDIHDDDGSYIDYKIWTHITEGNSEGLESFETFTAVMLQVEVFWVVGYNILDKEKKMFLVRNVRCVGNMKIILYVGYAFSFHSFKRQFR
jgi:hypothetical protein